MSTVSKCETAAPGDREGVCNLTEIEKEVQSLRQQNARLRDEIEKLKRMRMEDMSQIIFQRRQIDFLMEGKDGSTTG